MLTWRACRLLRKNLHCCCKCPLSVVVPYPTCSSPQLDQVQESDRPQKIQYYRRTIHAGYNGMAFTPWVTLPEEKTPDVHRPFYP
ncbi:hypothetical protein AVEN_92899-1 [Araneus ventricosus]|uniref:Uncharacterized protein n=1 Tax=Araneus ventricosus TaxID=182803 RepID=A0A4Y2D1U0_ARAVE|nr:hypothetical protein AVEN_92899-1 [Araneus ventricosus]